MQARTISLLLFGFAMTSSIQGQTNFFYDQQSAIEGASAETVGSINFAQPYGQSFVPTSNAVGFIRLWMRDLNAGNGLGADVFVNLRSNSISGPILGSSETVSFTDGFGGPGDRIYPDFFFTNPISVVPGVTYIFQPVVQSGDSVSVFADSTYNYSFGDSLYQGAVQTGIDLWFREGVITVPEPSSVSLGLAGAAALGWWRWCRNRRL
ncbi:MAG: PEP-CTERM sorting domain-containing protein [Verrucomicrobia bacterium]|nr:PEP-CTERM sorting domain-containing protein [Verrucomicrobiota bacterium]